MLLGDVIELRQGPLREALAVAKPVLEAIGAALGPDAEVVIVPGNHDHRLLRPWLGRRAADGSAAALGLEAAVDWREGEPLERLAAWLGPARTRAAYPGVWLRDDVYAMHGHYGDRNTTVPILERLGAGVMGRVLDGRNGRPASAEDYEATLAPMYAWIDAVAEQGGFGAGRGGSVQVRAWRGLQGSSRRRVRAGVVALGFRTLVFALNRAGSARCDRTCPARSFGAVDCARSARCWPISGSRRGHVIFGHTHRAGPLPGDDRSEWVTRRRHEAAQHRHAGCTNAGSSATSRGGVPTVPGSRQCVEDTRAPELVNLLDPA